MKNILTDLRAIRVESRLSQEAIGAALGKNSQAMISAYESGAKSPKLSTFCKWVDALDCEIVIQKKQP